MLKIEYSASAWKVSVSGKTFVTRSRKAAFEFARYMIEKRQQERS